MHCLFSKLRDLCSTTVKHETNIYINGKEVDFSDEEIKHINDYINASFDKFDESFALFNKTFELMKKKNR